MRCVGAYKKLDKQPRPCINDDGGLILDDAMVYIRGIRFGSVVDVKLNWGSR